MKLIFIAEPTIKVPKMFSRNHIQTLRVCNSSWETLMMCFISWLLSVLIHRPVVRPDKSLATRLDKNPFHFSKNRNLNSTWYFLNYLFNLSNFISSRLKLSNLVSACLIVSCTYCITLFYLFLIFCIILSYLVLTTEQDKIHYMYLE
jgi:hypothetical protein